MLHWCSEQTKRLLFFIQNAHSHESRKLSKCFVKFANFPSIAWINVGSLLTQKQFLTSHLKRNRNFFLQLYTIRTVLFGFFGNIWLDKWKTSSNIGQSANKEKHCIKYSRCFLSYLKLKVIQLTIYLH